MAKKKEGGVILPEEKNFFLCVFCRNFGARTPQNESKNKLLFFLLVAAVGRLQQNEKAAKNVVFQSFWIICRIFGLKEGMVKKL